jgi:diguanylate cyclase (GGDEF)-like protein
MRLDIPTLAVVTVFVTALLGGLLLFAGAQNRAVRAPTVWGQAFLIGATGLGLVVVRGRVPDWLSIECANALVLAGMSLVWAGARLFDRRAVRLAHVATVPALWFAACLVPDIGHDINARTILCSALAATLSVLTAREIWRGRGEPLLSRWPTVLTLFGYASAMLARVPATLFMPQIAGSTDFLGSALFPALAFGTLMFTVILAFLLLNMTKERTELQHKMASLVDPLSGVANRRAFLAGAEQIVANNTPGHRLGVMLFDLDHFKAINDANGHATGDAVIKLFAHEAAHTLGRDALFGRIGGEEFGALMRVSERGDVVAVAHRIRLGFASAAARSGLGVLATVSIGVAIADVESGCVEDLMAAADRALYRAKENGRNRVEYAGAAGTESALQDSPFDGFPGPERRAVGA